MRLTAAVLSLAFAVAVLAPASGAQAPPKSAEAALAKFERDRGDKSKRVAATRGLARFAEQSVTDALIGALASETDLAFKAELTDALGGIARDGVTVRLEDLLLEAPGSDPLRRAAAKGLARQGPAGVAALIAIGGQRVDRAAVEKAEGAERARLRDVRAAVLDGLTLAATPAAFDAIAACVTVGLDSERLPAIRGLAKAGSSPTANAARVAALETKDLEVAALAAGQLAANGHPGGDEAVLDVWKRVKADQKASGAARAALVRAMVPLLDRPDLFEPFLRQASASDALVASTVEEVAADIGAHQAFRNWLLGTGLQRTSELERCLAIRLLARAPEPRVTRVLLDLMRDPESAVVFTASRAIAVRGDRDAVPELRKLLAAPDGARRLETLFALHALLHGDASWHDELMQLANTSDRALRATVLDFLADLGSVAGLRAVWKDVDDKAWQVRAAAYDYCRKVRSAESIPHLIARVDQESGRLREDVIDTLQSLTARRYATTAKWNEWWSGASAGFELPPVAAEKSKPKSKRDSESETVSYYDIPLVSERVAFVVDTSGSMAARIGTNEKRTRLDEAKDQLRRVITRIPKTSRFNVVLFSNRGTRLLKELAFADDATRAEAIQRVDATKAAGGTNVYDGLKLAFEDQDVDTIYLLSDGYPSAGEIQDADALADEVKRWNRTRQVRVHCIAIGTESNLLKRIAAESGGQYVFAR